MSSVAIISSNAVTADAASRVCAAAGAAGHAANLFRVTPLDAPACVIRAARTGFDVVVVFQAGSEDVNTVSNTAGVPVLRVLPDAADAASVTARLNTILSIKPGGSSSAPAAPAAPTAAATAPAVGAASAATPPTSAPTIAVPAAPAAAAPPATPAKPGAAASVVAAGPRASLGALPTGSTATPARARGAPAFGTMKDVRSDVFGGEKGAAGLTNLDERLRPAFQQLRDTLMRFGGKGIAAIGRKFAIVDDDGSRTLNAAEFYKSMKEMKLADSLSKAEVDGIFRYFDHDGSGSVDYDEFLVGLRGELSPTRRAIVDMAFKVLDKDGSGEVTLDDIRERYDTSKHPEVISGRKSRDQVLREFLDGFDGGQRDGKVTPQEFARYYANVSAYIDHDDYFELMMRNVWHISGGEGWAANTSNRRVLVTRRDGSQQVMEVPDDLSCGTNVVLIKKALISRGVDAVAVSLYGGDDGSGAAAAMGQLDMESEVPSTQPPSPASSTPSRRRAVPSGHGSSLVLN